MNLVVQQNCQLSLRVVCPRTVLHRDVFEKVGTGRVKAKANRRTAGLIRRRVGSVQILPRDTLAFRRLNNQVLSDRCLATFFSDFSRYRIRATDFFWFPILFADAAPDRHNLATLLQHLVRRFQRPRTGLKIAMVATISK